MQARTQPLVQMERHVTEWVCYGGSKHWLRSPEGCMTVAEWITIHYEMGVARPCPV